MSGNALLRSVLVALLGALSGFAIGVLFSVAMTASWESAASFAQDWFWEWVVFQSAALGGPVGALSAFLADRMVLRELDLRAVLSRFPTLFGIVLLASLPWVAVPVVVPIMASLSLLFGAMWVRRRWDERGGE